jgi:hypothetical protein
LDIFSRYVVGWLLAQRECAHLASSSKCIPSNSPSTPTAGRP